MVTLWSSRESVVPRQHELGFIQWIRQRAAGTAGLQLGIGDDAAIWQPKRGPLLLTTDVLMDGVDFRVGEVTPRLIGRKAMAVNLSDLAAMAGIPKVALVGVALHKAQGMAFAQELHVGMQQLADEFDVAIIGGDTNTWDGPLVISVTLIGEATERGAVRRSGGRPGDWLFVTGSLGGSIHGHHLTFTPRVHEALALHEHADLHAMIDLSDGLSADLHHLLDESHLGATLEAAAIPISDAVRQFTDRRDPLDHALNDGEDFELLLAVSPDDGQKLMSASNQVFVARIGTLESAPGCRLMLADGRVQELPRGGWEHTFACG
jgi:thiamine-monophosphate kinase